MIKSTLFLLALSTSVFSFINNNTESILTNEEDVIEKTIYVDLSLNDTFKEDTANPYIRFTNESSGTINLVPSNEAHIYKTESYIPSDVLTNSSYHFEICSFDASSAEQVSVSINGGSSLIGDNYNYICLGASISGANVEIKGYGYYANRTANPSEATYKTQRVWMVNDNQDFYSDDLYSNVIGYTYESKFYMINMISYAASSLYYVDIPYQVSEIHYMRMLTINSYIIDKDYYLPLSYGVCYFASYDGASLTANTNAYSGATAQLLSYVVESYLTYGKDDSNGCTLSTVSSLFSTWFKNKSATSEELKNTKIFDYTGYAANGNSYEGLTKNAQFSINEKWNTMCSQAGIDPNTGELRSISLSWLGKEGTKAIIIIAAFAVVIIGITLLVVIYKKSKEINESKTYRTHLIFSYRYPLAFRFIKRTSDILLSCIAIVLCSVLFWWWITLINLVVTKGHPFFAPDRIGKDKKVFKMYKFRSMKMDAPIIPPYEMSDKDRYSYETFFGRFLRVTSLDETLQFINVIKGDMSIVGPRPGAAKGEDILVKARDSYTPSAFNVKPGITGYSQVYMHRQHDAMSKAWFDSEYIKKMSISLDIKIMVHTILFIKGK